LRFLANDRQNIILRGEPGSEDSGVSDRVASKWLKRIPGVWWLMRSQCRHTDKKLRRTDPQSKKSTN